MGLITFPVASVAVLYGLTLATMLMGCTFSGWLVGVIGVILGVVIINFTSTNR